MLFIAICLSSISFGQITESFDALADGSHANSCVRLWTVGFACIINSDKERGDSGRAVRFRHDNDVKSYLEFRGENANGISSGIGTISFWTRHWNDNGGTGVSFQVQYKQKDASTWTTVDSETDMLSSSIISVQNTDRLLLDVFAASRFAVWSPP